MTYFAYFEVCIEVCKSYVHGFCVKRCVEHCKRKLCVEYSKLEHSV